MAQSINHHHQPPDAPPPSASADVRAALLARLAQLDQQMATLTRERTLIADTLKKLNGLSLDTPLATLTQQTLYAELRHGRHRNRRSIIKSILAANGPMRVSDIVAIAETEGLFQSTRGHSGIYNTVQTVLSRSPEEFESLERGVYTIKETKARA